MFKFIKEKKGGDLEKYNCVMGVYGKRIVSVWIKEGKNNFKAVMRKEGSKGVTGWFCFV